MKADEHLADKLRAEAPGILFKLIQGCVDCLKMDEVVGFGLPQTVIDTSNEYLASQNIVAQWLSERVDSSAYETVTVSELFPDFVEWCDRQREFPSHRMEFNTRLKAAGINIKNTEKARGVCLGIRLKPKSGCDDMPQQPADEAPPLTDADAPPVRHRTLN